MLDRSTSGSTLCSATRCRARVRLARAQRRSEGVVVVVGRAWFDGVDKLAMLARARLDEVNLAEQRVEPRLLFDGAGHSRARARRCRGLPGVAACLVPCLLARPAATVRLACRVVEGVGRAVGVALRAMSALHRRARRIHQRKPSSTKASTMLTTPATASVPAEGPCSSFRRRPRAAGAGSSPRVGRPNCFKGSPGACGASPCPLAR